MVGLGGYPAQSAPEGRLVGGDSHGSLETVLGSTDSSNVQIASYRLPVMLQYCS